MMLAALNGGLKLGCVALRKWPLWSGPASKLTDLSLRNQVQVQVRWKSFLEVPMQRLARSWQEILARRGIAS